VFTDHCLSAWDAQMTHSLMNDAAVHAALETRPMLDPRLNGALNESLTEAWIKNLAGPLTKQIGTALAETTESALRVKLLRLVS